MSLHATDYNFGSLTEDFTIQPADKGRTIAPATTFNNVTGDTGIYWRGPASDVTHLHFDLGMLQRMMLNDDDRRALPDCQRAGERHRGQVPSAVSRGAASSELTTRQAVALWA